MSDTAALVSVGSVPDPKRSASTPPRNWLAEALFATFGRVGARIGAVWIGVIAFCAVFAPMLANSRPLLMKSNGQWSSPLVAQLTGVDVTLLAIFFAGLGLMFVRRLTMGERAVIVLWTVGVVLPLAYWPAVGAIWTKTQWPWVVRGGLILLGVVDVVALIGLPMAMRLRARFWVIFAAVLSPLVIALILVPPRPTAVPVYEQYREMEDAGEIEWVLRAPLPYSPSDRLRDQFDPDRPHPWAPSLSHPLGTERFGSDILSRMIHASRIAMAIGFISTGIALVIGVIIGSLMGYFVGWVDLLGMRLVEVFGAIPQLYLLLTFVAFFGRNLYLMMVIIGLTSWVGDARFVRAEFLRLRQQDFVQAARAAGLPLRSILFRHLLPNALAPLLVSVSFGVASAILAESTLSFLGLGLVDEPSWGQLLNQAVSAGGGFYWWLATFPGLAIFLTVFAYNLIGEALRDALDPRLSGVK